MKSTLKILLTAILSITLTIFMSSSYDIAKGETVRVRSYGTDNSVMHDIVRPGTVSKQNETNT